MEEKRFSFRCIAYQEKDGSFTGVCLDLDIVEEGHVSLQEAILSINDAIGSHMEAAAKLGFPDELIHRSAPKEYWKKLAEITKKRPVALPNQFQFFSVQSAPNFSYAWIFQRTILWSAYKEKVLIYEASSIVASGITLYRGFLTKVGLPSCSTT